MPNHGGLIQAGGQLQIIQPQLTQLPQQQLAQVITPSGQIQLAQIQPAQAANSQTAGLANFTQNANGTITIQVCIEGSHEKYFIGNISRQVSLFSTGCKCY